MVILEPGTPTEQSHAIIDALTERRRHAYPHLRGRRLLRFLTAMLPFFGQVFGFTPAVEVGPDQPGHRPDNADGTKPSGPRAPPILRSAGDVQDGVDLALVEARNKAAGFRSRNGDELHAPTASLVVDLRCDRK